ncbi:MAG TPA: bifunctional nicotinamidase/pyrazinamidase, partial [Chlamydiales bacterium]|nr:bifunctional nicotinamidase/pyrazinamidase [Chlamydiales bacterium]
LQNDFMPWGSLPVKEGNEILLFINPLMDRFSHVYATQDWHPEDHVSFAVNHGKRPGETIEVHHETQVLWPEHCVQNTLGADLVPGINKEKIEKIFTKGSDSQIDSYSAFFDNARKKETGLHQYLKKKNIKELYFAGVATDYCVKYSVLDALELGYKVFVIQDLCRGVDLHSGDVKRALEEMKSKGAKIILSKAI